jgi:serine/threonine protein kinase
VCSRDNQEFAAKVLSKYHGEGAAYAGMKIEIDTVNDLAGHPNIIKLIDAFIAENELNKSLVLIYE